MCYCLIILFKSCSYFAHFDSKWHLFGLGTFKENMNFRVKYCDFHWHYLLLNSEYSP